MKSRTYRISSLLCLCIFLIICAKEEKGRGNGSLKEANLPYRIIDLEQAKKYFDDGTHLFIDARDEIFYRLGHVRGSINLPVSKIDEHIAGFAAKYPATTQIVVYCSGSLCDSSYIIAKKLIEINYIEIEVFFGGWNSWSNANLPIETSND